MSDERDRNNEEEQKKQFAELLEREGYQVPASLGQQGEAATYRELREQGAKDPQQTVEDKPLDVTETLQEAQALTQGQGYRIQAESPEITGQMSPEKDWQIEQNAKAYEQRQAALETGTSSQLEQQFEQQSAEPEHTSRLGEAHETAAGSVPVETGNPEYAAWLDQAEATWEQRTQEFSQPEQQGEAIAPEQAEPAIEDYQPTAEDLAEYGQWLSEQNPGYEQDADLDAFFEEYLQQNPPVEQGKDKGKEQQQEQDREEMER